MMRSPITRNIEPPPHSKETHVSYSQNYHTLIRVPFTALSLFQPPAPRVAPIQVEVRLYIGPTRFEQPVKQYTHRFQLDKYTEFRR